MIKTLSMFAGVCVIAIGVAGLPSGAQAGNNPQPKVAVCHFEDHFEGGNLFDRAFVLPNANAQQNCTNNGGRWLIVGCRAVKGHVKSQSANVAAFCANLRG